MLDRSARAACISDRDVTPKRRAAGWRGPSTPDPGKGDSRVGQRRQLHEVHRYRMGLRPSNAVMWAAACVLVLEWLSTSLLASPVSLSRGASNVSSRHDVQTLSRVEMPSGPASRATRQADSSSSRMVLTIDGEKTPDRVPDDLAYRHFISITSVGALASKDDLSRRDAVLQQVGLSASDQAAFVVATYGVRDRIGTIDKTLRDGHHDLAFVEDQRRVRAGVLDDAANRILSSVSPSGASRLKAHIRDYVKRRIRIYGQEQR
jgi:hypothetical protein